MADFKEIVNAPAGSKFILQGNAAFALGVVHAGYHAATGYPGTPSTEVIDKSLAFVQDRIKVGWSVNEAVAVSVGVGHATAGYDTVVTMKIPGVFQAADAITTTAFFTGKAGALVILAVTDYVPSSTQHVIDSRYFFASSRLPVLEPRNHQEMYDIPKIAADMSRRFNTPVIVLASGILAHSEALIMTKQQREVTPKELPKNLKEWMLLPVIARANYNKVTQHRIPEIKKWCEDSNLINETYGTDDWGIIVSGESDIIVREALKFVNVDPSILSLAITYPIPEKRIKEFAKKTKGKLFVIEDGYKFLEERIRLLNIEVIGKDEDSTITNWSPEEVLGFLSSHIEINYKPQRKSINLKPILRPPSICPGCSYKPLALAVGRLKRTKKIYASFGDIGCSTLLYFFDALDTVSCMGASDSIRQGFVMSRPEMANKVISIIGDSTECHSGLDSTRNAVFRNVPGVKIILDNRITAMTGGQPAPSSDVNLEGQHHKFNLKRAIEAEGGRTLVIDAYNTEEIEKELEESLKLADKGIYTTLILEGTCIHEVESEGLLRKIEIDYDKCKNCDLCNICPGIVLDENRTPHFTSLCTDCGSGIPVCLQRCPFDAIVYTNENEKKETIPPKIPNAKPIKAVTISKDVLPESLGVAIRGIGGQGNLFFGKVLSEVALRTPYSDTHIVKGDTHGMAQLGGPVISTFSCGKVYSPVPAPSSIDVIVVMEISEVLRPGFLDLLKQDGTIIFNNFTTLPVNAKPEDYPDIEEIEKALAEYNVVKIDANKVSFDLGDTMGRSANVVVLGVLSTIKPFNLIPKEIWLDALTSVSNNKIVMAVNSLAFNEGRKILIETT